MKKLFTLILSGLAVNYSANAQALPNPGFENWTAGSGYENPNNWSTLNSATSFLGIVTVSKSTDAHGGTYSLRGETKFIGAPFNQAAPALVTTGTINTTTQEIEGGIAYTERPDSVAGWMKYAPVNVDTGYIEVLLMNANATDTVARARFDQPVAASEWFRFSAPFVYSSSANPELSRVILLPSSGYSPVVGSVVQFDDLEFVFTTGINENNEIYPFSVYPNPATDELFIKNPLTQTAKMQVYDVAGKKVNELNIGLNTTRASISTYAPGVYIYMFTDNNSEILHTGKFAVAR
ncbi:MAG: T9SS type A sorting domain-containing protein [Bacteroidia bacterium]